MIPGADDHDIIIAALGAVERLCDRGVIDAVEATTLQLNLHRAAFQLLEADMAQWVAQDAKRGEA